MSKSEHLTRLYFRMVNEIGIISQLSSNRLERVLPAFTSNVADLLRLPGKGRIRAGMDADLLALDANGAAGHVWLGGIAHLRAGEVVRRGMFER